MEAEYVWPVRAGGQICPSALDMARKGHTFIAAKTTRHFEGHETVTETNRLICQHCLIQVNTDGKIVRKPGQP